MPEFPVSGHAHMENLGTAEPCVSAQSLTAHGLKSKRWPRPKSHWGRGGLFPAHRLLAEFQLLTAVAGGPQLLERVHSPSLAGLLAASWESPWSPCASRWSLTVGGGGHRRDLPSPLPCSLVRVTSRVLPTLRDE